MLARTPRVEAAVPSLAPPGVIYNGARAAGFGAVAAGRSYPDARSFRLKLGLLLPVTNTTIEHELWSILRGNAGRGLEGIGIHSANVVTPRARFGNRKELEEYRRQFLGGLETAADQAMMAAPHALVMGMSLEHIVAGLDQVRAPLAAIEARSGLSVAGWHDAAATALASFQAKRIGLLTPFDKHGNANAARLFEDLGFKVVAGVGFSCALAQHIAHIADWAKEKAILELLATRANRLDAIVQCGTNMSLVQLSERLEPILEMPVIGINAALLWHALRKNGISDRLFDAGRLLREF